EVYHQLVLGWCLHWQISWLFALEDAVDITGCASVMAGNIRAICDQSTMGDEHAIRINGGQSMSCGKRDDQVPVRQRRRTHHNNESSIRRLRERRDSAFNFLCVGQIYSLQFCAE